MRNWGAGQAVHKMVNVAEAPISPATGTLDFEGAVLPALGPGEGLIATAEGVRLGWQWPTILVWWLPGLLFIGLAVVEFHSWIVTIGLTVFCIALFLFYAQDREVRPRREGQRYVLTDRRLLIVADNGGWREIALGDIAATHMESGAADRAVAAISRAATIVLELSTPGPKGQPRRVRIGPLRGPVEFRGLIDARRGGG
jgi:hypothetical protein